MLTLLISLNCFTVFGLTFGNSLTNENILNDVLKCGPPIDALTVTHIDILRGRPAYWPNSHCTWIVRAQPGYDIKITFNRFHTESPHDVLTVYTYKCDTILCEKINPNHYTGYMIPPPLNIESNAILIQFISDDSVQESGFDFNISRQINQCGIIDSKNTKTLSSPGYPSNYPNNMNCSWNISAEENEFITLDFQTFNTQLGADKLFVYEKGLQTLILEKDGNIETPFIYKTNSSFLTVVFISDSSINYSGFEIKISRDKKIVVVNSCGGQIDSPLTRLISPNHPNHYENNMTCIWNVKGIKNSIIHLFFNDFSTQPMHDYLYVYDGNTTNHTLIGEYSGFSLPNDLTSTSNEITIMFNSDESTNETGFDIIVKFEILLENSAFFISQSTKNNETEEYSVNYMKYNSKNNQIITKNEQIFYKLMDFNSKDISLVLYRNHTNEMEIIKFTHESNEITVIKNVGKPNSLAIDWIHDLIYWIDSVNNEIKAVEYSKPIDIYLILKLNNCISKNLIINVEKSLLLWVCYKNPVYNIMETSQAGEKLRKIYRNIRPIDHLIIDYHSKKYYFILDNSLVSLDFKGFQNRLLKSPKLFSSITNMFILNEELYYVTEHALFRLLSIDTKIEKSIVVYKDKSLNYTEDYYVDFGTEVLDIEKIHYMFAINNESQPDFNNKCSTANCSNACVPTQSPDDYRCLCPMNMEMVNQTYCRNITKVINNENIVKEVSQIENITQVLLTSSKTSMPETEQYSEMKNSSEIENSVTESMRNVSTETPKISLTSNISSINYYINNRRYTYIRKLLTTNTPKISYSKRTAIDSNESERLLSYMKTSDNNTVLVKNYVTIQTKEIQFNEYFGYSIVIVLIITIIVVIFRNKIKNKKTRNYYRSKCESISEEFYNNYTLENVEKL